MAYRALLGLRAGTFRLDWISIWFQIGFNMVFAVSSGRGAAGEGRKNHFETKSKPNRAGKSRPGALRGPDKPQLAAFLPVMLRSSFAGFGCRWLSCGLQRAGWLARASLSRPLYPGGARVLQPGAPVYPGLTYTWGFGSRVYPGPRVQLGPERT